MRERFDVIIMLLFLCFLSCCTTCNYVSKLVDEQHKTNIYLKIDYREDNCDTSGLFIDPNYNNKKSKSK